MNWIDLGQNLGLGLLITLGFLTPVQATEPDGSSKRILAVGVLAHDSGPFSDHHENGVDLSLEAQFAPLGILGAPRPHLVS